MTTEVTDLVTKARSLVTEAYQQNHYDIPERDLAVAQIAATIYIGQRIDSLTEMLRTVEMTLRMAHIENREHRK